MTAVPANIVALFDPTSHGGLLSIPPAAQEELASYAVRLGASATPEEALLVLALSLSPQDGVSWAFDCCETVPDAFNAVDTDILRDVEMWISSPTDQYRASLLQRCLWSTNRRPAVLIGLAVGFSGASLAPQWPAPISSAMSPNCVYEAILAALTRVPPQHRDATIKRFVDGALRYI